MINYYLIINMTYLFIYIVIFYQLMTSNNHIKEHQKQTKWAVKMIKGK